MRETLQKNINFQIKALRAKESATSVREHKEVWRTIQTSKKEKMEEAYQERLYRMAKNKGINPADLPTESNGGEQRFKNVV